MKRYFNLTAALLMVGSIYSCKDDPVDPAPGSNTDAVTEANTDAKTDVLSNICATHKGSSWVGCAVDGDQKQIILGCNADGSYLQHVECYAHSTCKQTDNTFTCQCDNNYTLTAADANDENSYYCKLNSNYPEDVYNVCSDKENGYTACVTSGSDTWAVYCVDKAPYDNDGTGNCTTSSLKCGEVTYNNGKFFECTQCLVDTDCSLSSSATFEHAQAICENNQCKDACESGYRIEDIGDLDDEELACVAVDNYCRQSSDCSSLDATEGQFFICSNYKCDSVCKEGYNNKWDAENKHYCEKAEEK